MGIDNVGASDGELVRRVRAGDVGAYAALVARYRDRLGRYAVHMLGDRQDAEEALQDAFVRAYRSLARCDDPGSRGSRPNTGRRFSSSTSRSWSTKRWRSSPARVSRR